MTNNSLVFEKIKVICTKEAFCVIIYLFLCFIWKFRIKTVSLPTECFVHKITIIKQ